MIRSTTANEVAKERTFGSVLDAYLLDAERRDRSPTTLRSYRSQIESTIRPLIGWIPLADLNAWHLDDFYGQLKMKGLSAKTIRNYHVTISGALTLAVRWEWVDRNVATRAQPPSIPQRGIDAPSPEDVLRLVEAAGERRPPLGTLILLGALTGMRRGELCGLRWSSIDLLGRSIEVSRSVVVVPEGLAEKSTKTGRGRRISLDSTAVTALTSHRERVRQLARGSRASLHTDAFVFSPVPDCSRPFRPDTVTSFFIGLRDELGLHSVRLHDLRHFTATRLIAAGIDARTVAGRLGHSDPSVTLRIYAHALAERDREAADIMGELLHPPG
jgi:integrase